MWTLSLLLILALMCQCQSQTIVKQVCSANTSMTEVEAGADIIIGGLFEIRDVGTNGIGCGRPVRDMMQAFEAARYTINWLNNFNGGNGYISGVKFGMRAYDTCFSSSSALRALQMLYPQTTSSSPFCSTSNQVITGTVGPLSSGASMSVAALAGELPVSVISPSAVAYQLSDKFKYPTFLRTVPSNVVYAKAVVELLQQLQWHNVIVVYVGDTYGRSTYEQLLRATYNRGLCVTQAVELASMGDKDSHKAALAALGSSNFSAAILIGGDAQIRVILEAANELPTLANIQWILSELDITHDASSLVRARGALVVAPSSPTVADFAQYFAEREAAPRNNVGNPWFEDWYEATYGCALTGTTNACTVPTVAQARANFRQSPWAVPTMKAIFAYVETVRSICSGSGGGACQALRSMTPTQFHQALKDLDFTFPATFGIQELRGQRISFDANGDPEVSDFTVYNYNNRAGSYVFEEIGSFQSNGLTLSRQPTLYDAARNTILTTNPMATCPTSGCENCLLPQRSVTFRYSPGDVVVGSLINAHLPGRAAFTCGDGIIPRLSALVAAEWAVSQFKTNNPNQFRQVSIGSLVADICPDDSVAEGFLTDVLSGNNRLTDQTGAVISYNNIYAFVDQTESGQAESISPILSKYMIPEVQSGATDPTLTNGGMTPYFSRAIPNDEVYYMAVSSILQRLGWKYVQVATSSMGHYYEMTKTFTRVAAKYGVCVVDMADYFDDTTSDRYNRTLTHLLSNQEAQVVVVIGDMMDIRGLLTAISQRGVVGQLQLISGTDRWSRNLEYIRGLEAAAAGSIVLDLEMGANAAFNTYLSGLSRDQIAAHPFMRELFEITNQCSLDPSTRGVYPKTCDNTATFSVYQGTTPYVIESVNAVLRQLHLVIAEVCQSTQYSGLCPEFLAATDIRSRLDAKLQDLAKSGGFGIKNGEGITDLQFYVYSAGFTQFGLFNTENKRLTSVDTTRLGNYQARASTCSGVCIECQYLFSMQTGLYTMGDWIIAGAFGVSDPGPEALQPYICGDVRLANGPQYTMAMMYALQRVNSGQARVSVKGVTFGGLILDHCNNPGRANLMVADIYAGFLNTMGVDQSRILAWLTDNTASTNEAAELLDPLGIAMVSPSATSASLMDYPTFYRTIQGDATAASALVKIVKSLGFPYIQVAYAANEYGRGGLDTMMAVSQSEGICITNSVELSNDTNDDVAKLLAAETQVVVLFMGTADTTAFLRAISNNNIARTKLLILMPEPYAQAVQAVGSQLTHPIISLRLQRSTLADYNAYINNSPTSNPYFARYYMKVMNCNLPGYSTYPSACPATLSNITSGSSYQEDNFILSTIDAVYAVVDAWDRTVREDCGPDYTTPCPLFLQATDKRARFNTNLNSIVFVDEGQKTFRFLNREGNTAYDILQSNSQGQYKTIGSYAGVSLDLNDASMTKYTGVESLCTAPCLGCIMRGLNFSHIPGDIYLAGLFDVHERYLSPFTCGSIQTLHGFLLLEAFNYAIEQVNNKKGQFKDILTGTRLGGVGLDACGSEIRGGYLVSNINNGLTTLAKDGVVITPSKIDAYIGSYGSKPSIYLARILTDLEIPQISYAAGSDELNDTRVYPFFYRTVPSDGKQVDAILKFLDEMDIRYVQILYEGNSNGMSAKDDFIRRAAEHSICVAQAVSYPDLGVASPETSSAILTELIEKPAANAVVTFLSTVYVNSMLKAVGSSNKVTADELRFIGSSSWGDNQDAIINAEEQARGSITIKLDADDVDEFERHINSKTLANSGENPWFEEYYQKILNCYTSKANTMGYPQPCPLNPTSLINSPGYQQDPGVVYVIDAVYAAAFAIHDTLKELCGSGYTAVCQAYRSNSGRRPILRDKLANVSFTDPMGNNFVFSNRSGIASYRFNSIETGSLGGIGYQQIGSYDVKTGMVDVYSSYVSTWDSDCDREDACAECPAIRDSGIRYVFHKRSAPAPTDPNNSPNVKTIVAFFDVHKQGVDPYRCGDINPVGFQQLLSFFYTIENVLQVAQDSYRFLAIDTCSNSLRIDQDLFGLLQGNGLCNSRFDDMMPVSIKNVASVITIGDANTMAASRVLEMPGITYLSPNALSTMLDNKQHLVRTIAPISAMMRTLVSLLNKLGWNYVDVVYEDSAEGVYPYEKFAYYANLERVCRGSNIMVGTGADTDVQNLLAQLSGNMGSKAVILLGSTNVVRRVFMAANTLGIIDDYVWVLGVEWELTDDVLREILPVGVEVRIIMVSRLTDMVQSFNSYVSRLTYGSIHFPSSSLSVPTEWYDEFYQTLNKCTISSSEKPINLGMGECNTTKALNMTEWQQFKYTVNTVAATYAAVNGLDKCAGKRCANFQFLDNTGARMDIMNNILDVTWVLNSLTGDFNLTNKADLELKFDRENRWWDTGYLIKYLVVKKTDASNVMMSKNQELFRGQFNPTAAEVEKAKTMLAVTSECKDGENGCGCAFTVVGEPQPLVQERFQPTEPRNYYDYDGQGRLRYDWSIWAIATAVLTSIGGAVAIILFFVLLFAYPKRGGTSILGYMTIFGVICLYAINFAFFVHATDATCGIRRFLFGVAYMITFAPLLIKAIDNWRFGHIDYSGERYSGISSFWAMFLIAIAIVLIQCIIPIMWLILVHPTATLLPPVGVYRHDNWWCDPPEDYDVGLVLSFVFVMFIVLVTAIFSALAYDTERNNYESRWILFGCIATAGCFMVWMIVSTNAGPPYRDAAVTIANFVNATILLIVVPIRKSVLLIRSKREKAEKEDEAEVMNGSTPYDLYSNGNSYANPTFELSDYDNEFVDSRPEEL